MKTLLVFTVLAFGIVYALWHPDPYVLKPADPGLPRREKATVEANPAPKLPPTTRPAVAKADPELLPMPRRHAGATDDEFDRLRHVEQIERNLIERRELVERAQANLKTLEAVRVQLEPLYQKQLINQSEMDELIRDIDKEKVTIAQGHAYIKGLESELKDVAAGQIVSTLPGEKHKRDFDRLRQVGEIKKNISERHELVERAQINLKALEAKRVKWEPLRQKKFISQSEMDDLIRDIDKEKATISQGKDYIKGLENDLKDLAAGTAVPTLRDEKREADFDRLRRIGEIKKNLSESRELVQKAQISLKTLETNRVKWEPLYQKRIISRFEMDALIRDIEHEKATILQEMARIKDLEKDLNHLADAAIAPRTNRPESP